MFDWTFSKKHPLATPKDIFGVPIPSADPPFDHISFIREEIFYNSNGDVVRIDRIFVDESGSGEAKYSKPFTPRNLDTTPSGNPLVIGKWDRV